MKTLYESILSSTKSGKESLFKSFYIRDIEAINPNVKLNKILNIKKMKDYINENSNIVVLINDKDAIVFGKFLCTIEFTTKEWEILKNPSNPENIDLLLKNKLRPFIKEKTINDYSFCVDEKYVFIKIENEVNPKELINTYTKNTTIVWFDKNFEF